KPQYKIILQDICVYFDKKIRNNPRNLTYYINNGKALLLLHDRNQEAINVYNMAIIHGDTSAYVYSCRGFAYERQKNYQKAFDDYNKALSINPNSPWIRQKLQNAESKIVQPQTSFWQKLRGRLHL
ncbi:MAG: tetratricopeptide repeat protein, partial [Chloroflexota bacterium]|nr:tetratricopeptide repeat protein [Chloroflexota bacterium]